MKEHLKNVFRKNGTYDKSVFDYVLSQNEKNISSDHYSEFFNSLNYKDINFYPNLTSFKTKLADYNNLTEDNILITPGSDIGLKTIFESLDLKNKTILTTQYSFPMYKVYADLYESNLLEVPYTNMKCTVDSISTYIDGSTALIVLANPNSPVGTYYSEEDLKFLLSFGIPTIIDEAYREFVDFNSANSLIKQYSNLFVTKTFSKAFGAAGLRVGYVCSCADNITVLNSLRFMYEIPGISAKYCEYILDNIDIFKKDIVDLKEYKDILVRKLKKRGQDILDTDSSWFFIKKTPKLEEVFDTNRVDIREFTFKGVKEVWYKFNVDLIIKGSKLEKELHEI